MGHTPQNNLHEGKKVEEELHGNTNDPAQPQSLLLPKLTEEKSTNNQSESTNNQSETTNNQSESTNNQNQSESTNNQSESTNNQSESTNNPSESMNNQSESTNKQSESTNNQSESTNKQSESTNQKSESRNSSNFGLDVLQQALQQFCAENNVDKRALSPILNALPLNTEVNIPASGDDVSALTDFADFTVATKSTKSSRQRSNRALNVVSEESRGNLWQEDLRESMEQQSLASDEIKLPFIPPPSIEEALSGCESLQRLYGSDEEAIRCITEALITDNAGSKTVRLALLCLTKLWDLSHQNESNKRLIVIGRTFDAIIKSMQIHNELSEIAQVGCRLIWSLSMNAENQRRVVEGRGCEAILNAQLEHMSVSSMQEMAMGGLKVLSFNSFSRSIIMSKMGSSIICDVMNEHVFHAGIQTEGCVIIYNLTGDINGQLVQPVSDREVSVVLDAILAHPDSLDVNQAALFTLTSLASLVSNAAIIRHHPMSVPALESLQQKFPEELNSMLLTLIKRLKS